VSLDSKIEDLQNRLRSLEALRQTPGWELLTAAADAYVRNERTKSFNSRITSIEDAFEECNTKANIAGAQFILGLPFIMEDEARTNLKEALVEREEEDA